MHVCEVCFNRTVDHGECCEPGHWPPTCCLGCGCGSFESSHLIGASGTPDKVDA